LLSLLCSITGFLLLAPTSVLLPTTLETLAPLCFLLHCAGEGIERKASRLYLLHLCLEKEIRWSHRIVILTALLKILCAFYLPNNLLIPSLFACGTIQSLLQGIKNHVLLKGVPLPLQATAPASLSTFQRLFSESWPLTPPQILGQLSKTSAPFLLASTWGNETLGIYALALKHSIFYSIATQMLHERHLDKQNWRNGLQYAALFTLPTILTLPLIPLLYGAAFYDALFWSLCLIPTHILTLVSIAHSQNLHTQNLSATAAQRSLLSHLLTLALNLYLIPSYGIAGSVIAAPLGLVPLYLPRTKTPPPSPSPH
jgi:O-antigen/teichoic acid export membrane protein